MNTLRLRPDQLAVAADLLRRGRLVAFPTETVYGLGADALDADAVGRVFEAKGRPSFNPLIVHVADAAGAGCVAVWSDVAERLAARFWPGPLTLVLSRRDAVPDVVTGGGPTVAVRVPAHPLARALIDAAAPLAAPSANRSGRLSPTTADHVLADLDGLIDAVLDGGPTAAGIESTVLDVSGPVPRLLRPGPIAPAEIEALIGPVARGAVAAAGALPSPGMLERHYAPRTPLVVAADDGVSLVAPGVGLLTHHAIGLPAVERLPPDPAGYAAGLYAALHRLDRLGLTRIVVSALPDGDDWLAVRDRLRRAAA